MNYNFTDQTRSALSRTRDEAGARGHDYVGTEHILLGLVSDATVAAMLGQLGIAADDVQREVAAHVRSGKARVERGELPYTSRAKKVLEFAMQEARESRARSVGIEHILLGVLREEKGIGAQVLRGLGATLKNVRTLIAGGENAGSPRVAASFDARGGIRVRIDDASDRSIYEQIVSQVTEAVATGEVRPGERLPTVRQLADELDVAPGTVARAYSELERQGLVITEGARGTRVAEREAARRELERPETLTGLLRPVAVAAFHLGATAAELRAALDDAMRGIFDKRDHAA